MLQTQWWFDADSKQGQLGIPSNVIFLATAKWHIINGQAIYKLHQKLNNCIE